MKLTFLGRGAAFYPIEGNNSAYFIENNELFLIDCGETVFESIYKRDILKDIKNVNIMITHTHADHIGSIGSLVMYCYFNLNTPVNIIMKKDAKHIKNINMVMDGCGVNHEAYKYINEEEFDNKYETFKSIRYQETTHSSKFACYSLIFETNDGTLYYSGDSNDITYIKKLIESNTKIDKLFVDTNTSPNLDTGHLYIGLLDETIPQDLRNKVYCMHVNSSECITKAKELGFNVVDVKK